MTTAAMRIEMVLGFSVLVLPSRRYPSDDLDRVEVSSANSLRENRRLDGGVAFARE